MMLFAFPFPTTGVGVSDQSTSKRQFVTSICRIRSRVLSVGTHSGIPKQITELRGTSTE